MDDAKQILIKARDLLANVGWCKHFFSLDKSGIPGMPTMEGAVAYCALGAIGAAAGNNFLKEASAVSKLQSVIPDFQFVSRWNNAQETTKEDVIAGFNRAIALCET